MESPKKKGRLSTPSDCLIHCTNSTGALVTLDSLESWQTLLNAARIRNHLRILEIEEENHGKDFPFIQYHRDCRSIFTMKRDLEKLQKAREEEQPETSSNRRQSIRQSCQDILLPKKCIICDKVNKYKNKKLLPLVACERKLNNSGKGVFQERIYNAATAVNDMRILRLCENYEFLAAEAHYHKDCYLNYIKQKKKVECSGNKEIQEQSPYELAEGEAFISLFQYIRKEILYQREPVLMTELTSHFECFMKDKGFTIDKAVKKKLRKKVKDEFYASARVFDNTDGRLIFLPTDTTKEELASTVIELRKKISLYQEDSSTEKFLDIAADTLRTEIKSCKSSLDWPPKIDRIESEQTELPTYLSRFLNQLFNKVLAKDIRINSVGQDILYIVSKGRFLTTKHVLLPFTVKSLTGNVELVKMINRLGHGVSYSKVAEIETAIAQEKLSTPETTLPNKIYKNIPTTAVFDNIDRLEETLSGSGTTHRVNGILIQCAFIGPVLPADNITVAKSKKRSIEVPHCVLPTYNAGRKPEVPILVSPVEILSTDDVQGQFKNFIWTLVRYCNRDAQKVSSWTGFNMLARRNHYVQKDSIGYLPTIDSPATQMNTVFEILNKANTLKDALELKSLIVVFDQAIYAKGIEIIWKHQELFSGIVLRLGTFHTIGVLMAVIGQRFTDAGLRDIVIESKVIAPGATKRVISGSYYNRAVRFHKLMFEACMRLVWESFLQWIEQSETHGQSVNQALEKIRTLENQDEMDEDVFQSVCNEKSVTELFELFQQFCQVLRSDNGTLSRFWMSYLDLVTVLLTLIRASREGNWLLHLSSVREMIPWCFSYNRINYCRYLPWYYREMMNLPVTHPELHNYLMNGGFSCQIGATNTFGRIPMDQSIEETINKDTQTPGGTKGFSTKPNAVAKYYITADDRANYVRQLREFISKENRKFGHPDITKPRIKRDERDINSLYSLLKETWRNPFELSGEELCCISTGVVPTAEAVTEMCEAKEKGEASYQTFVRERLEERSVSFFATIPTMKLKTFPKKNVKTKTSTGKEVILKSDKNLFSIMTIVAQSRQLDMREVFNHPLGPVPWSLATVDGFLKKTNKASLSQVLEKLSIPAENLPENRVTIVDAMSIVQKIKGAQKTFGDIAKVIFNIVTAEAAGSKRIDVVFDVYRNVSIKNIERMENRSASTALQFRQILPTHKIQQWQQFLKGAENKKELIKFLANEWKKEDYRNNLRDKEMFLAYEEECWKITRAGSTKVNELCTNQEEADTRMFLHFKQAEFDGHQGVVIISEDTDVFVLAVYVANEIPNVQIYQKRGTTSRTRFVNISAITNSLGTKLARSLPGLHAFTGCDTVSAFAGQGKLKAWKLLKKNEKFEVLFTNLGGDEIVSTDVYEGLEQFTCHLYGMPSCSHVNEARYEKFCAKKGKIESNQLPPCQNALRKHIDRANYQARVWKNCLVPYPQIPNPSGHGWKLENSQFTIDWMTIPPAPDSILEFLSCNCTKSCDSNRCICRTNGLKCTDMCKLKDCSNATKESDGEESDNDSDGEVSDEETTEDEDNEF